jgi:transcription initiation factor TFIIB
MIRKYQMWNAMSYRERSLYNVCDSLTVFASRNGISASILEEAKNLYKKISDVKISRGENRQAIIASCVYIACKTQGVPRSIKEISEMFNIRIQCLTKACKTFHDMLNVQVASSTPQDFVNRFCNKMGLAPEFMALCISIVDTAMDMEILSEYTPPSAVAGCIMISNDIMKTKICKKMVSEVCQISIVTISKCHKHLKPFTEVLAQKTVM